MVLRGKEVWASSRDLLGREWQQWIVKQQTVLVCLAETFYYRELKVPPNQYCNGVYISISKNRVCEIVLGATKNFNYFRVNWLKVKYILVSGFVFSARFPEPPLCQKLQEGWYSMLSFLNIFHHGKYVLVLFFFTLNLKTSSQNILHFGDSVYEVPGRCSTYVFWNFFWWKCSGPCRGHEYKLWTFSKQMSVLVPMKCKDICLRSDVKYQLFRFFSKISF